MVDWRKEQSGAQIPSAWIVDEFVKHLEGKGLYMSGPVRGDDLSALERYEEALTRLKGVLDIAQTAIDNRVKELGLPQGEREERRGARRPEFWMHFGSTDPLLGGKAWLEWNVRTPDGADQVSLGAGLTLEAPAVLDVDVAAALEEHEFVIGDDHGFSRAFRYKPLIEFLRIGSTADEQAKEISDWVCQGLQDCWAAVR